MSCFTRIERRSAKVCLGEGERMRAIKSNADVLAVGGADGMRFALQREDVAD